MCLYLPRPDVPSITIFVICAHSSIQGVQLYIEVQDEDIVSMDAGINIPDDLVDMFLINCDTMVGMESPRKWYSGVFNFSTVELAINVSCDTNFQGSDCSQCVSGFTGPDCQQIDECVGVNCTGNGRCVDGENSFNCNCDPGFTGELCQTDIDECIGVNCSGKGECLDGVNSFTCECSLDYTGPLCDNIIIQSKTLKSNCKVHINT